MRSAGGAMHEADVRAGLRHAVLASRPDQLEVLLALPVVSLTPPQLVERLRARHVAQLVAPLTRTSASSTSRLRLLRRRSGR